VWYIPYSNQDLLMDVYEPLGDDNLKRPLMIWVHPGGFLLGDKEAEDMVALCDSFTRRGYVTASVGYRLGFNPVDSESAERAVYRGTQDVRAAIRYLKEYASVFGIDTTSIFLGGSSAGGVATLHVAYLDQEEAPTVVYGDGNLVPNLLSLDSSGNFFNHTVELKGIVNMWGALGDSTFIDSDETTPALLIHGTADAVVPFGVGNPFGVFTTPLVHGSRAISNQLASLSIPHANLFFEGQDHEPHGTSNGYWEDSLPTAYWDTIFNAINWHYYT
jgi:acetyl esterase/lipase